MKQLKLAPEVSLELDALMQPIGVLGNRGSGKTYLGQKLYELAHSHDVQCIAVDPIGKWPFLRLGKDGQSAGLNDVFIFGGKRGDFPITPQSGAFVAKVIVEKRIHAVLDVSLMRKGERHHFLTDFAEELFLLKKQEEAPAPSLLFIEEAHTVLPQRPQKGQERMLGAFEDLVREGRNAAIGVVILDQRPATVNKNALALVEILIALRTTYKLDRDVYEDWIVQKADAAAPDVDLAKVLPFLKAGQGYLYAPLYDLFSKVTITAKQTFDASATAKVGQKRVALGTLTPVDMDMVRGAMAQVVAEVDNSNPTKLRARIRELEKALEDEEHGLDNEENLALRNENRELTKRLEYERKVIEDFRVKVAENGDALHRLVGDATMAAEPPEKVKGGERALDGLRKASADFMGLQRGAHEMAKKGAHMKPLDDSPAAGFVYSKPTIEEIQSGDVKLKKGAREMLRELRWCGELTREELATRAIMSSRSGTFSDYLSALRRAEFISDHGGRKIHITTLGVSFANGMPPRKSRDEIVTLWGQQLKLGARNMLNALIKADGVPLTRDMLAAAAQMSVKSGTFSDYLSALRRSGCVEQDENGNWVASMALE